MDVDSPVLTISAAAELAGMHPQTLRQYDRLGLVTPRRARGRGRRYSLRDVQMLREVQRLSQDEGVNLAGIKRILELERDVLMLRDHLERLQDALRAESRVFAASASGDVVVVPRGRRVSRGEASSSSGALVLWRGAHRG